MKRKYVLAAVLSLALAGALAYFYGDARVPAGQPPLEVLMPRNVDDVKNAFNAVQDHARVVLLLSPT